jgi:lambda repressor-like predicted transcriptional regulator
MIPRAVHAKVLKRGWHTEDQLEKVAWLCRACHSFVHRVASNEELAKEFYSVERLLGKKDVVKFAGWVGKLSGRRHESSLVAENSLGRLRTTGRAENLIMNVLGFKNSTIWVSKYSCNQIATS